MAITSNNAADRFVHLTNGAALTVAPRGQLDRGHHDRQPGRLLPTRAAGSVTIGAGARINLSNFQSLRHGHPGPRPDGRPGDPADQRRHQRRWASGGGSRTFIATPATAGQNLAIVDLKGHNAIVAGGLFVNNGFVGDSTSTGATIVADYGALVKGAGTFANPVITQNGGKFQAGNSPGKATFGQLTVGPGGTQNFNWQINNATGVAGPMADANGQVSGWSLLSSEVLLDPITGLMTTGNLTWTATSVAGAQFNMALQTLINPTTVGNDVQGAMANFDGINPPGGQYLWKLIQWQGTYTGPTTDAALNSTVLFDKTNFVNPTDPVNGMFSLHYNPGAKEIDVIYSVPEPGTLGLVGLGGLAAGWAARRKQKAKAAKA